jgi:hypothetical protein
MNNPMDLLANVATAVDHLDNNNNGSRTTTAAHNKSTRSVSTSTLGSAASSSYSGKVTNVPVHVVSTSSSDAAAAAARSGAACASSSPASVRRMGPPTALQRVRAPNARFDPAQHDDDRIRRVSMEHSVASLAECSSSSSTDGSVRDGADPKVRPRKTKKSRGEDHIGLSGCGGGGAGMTTEPTLLDVVVVPSDTDSPGWAEEEDVRLVGNEFYRKVIHLNAARYAGCANKYVLLIVVVWWRSDSAEARSLTHPFRTL